MITYDFTKKAKKQLNKLPLDIQRRIVKKVDAYCSYSDPLSFAKHLVIADSRFYRYQIGNYRAIFRLENDNILFTKIEHRGSVYQLPFWSLFF